MSDGGRSRDEERTYDRDDDSDDRDDDSDDRDDDSDDRGDDSGGRRERDDETDDEWRFSVDEVGEDARTPERTLEPGTPSLENVVFVLLGVLLTIGFVLLAL